MDWTTTGAPPPMGTSPTLICRLGTGRSRTAASVISLPNTRCHLILFRDERRSGDDFTNVRVGCEHEQHKHQRHPEGRELAHRLLAHGPPQKLLRRYKEQVPPVQREERQQVEERQVEADDRQQRQEEAVRHRRSPHGPAHVLHERSLTRHEVTYKSAQRRRDLPAPGHGLPERRHGPIGILYHHRPYPDEGPPRVLGVRDQLPRHPALLTISADDELDPVSRFFLAHAPDEALPIGGLFAVHGDYPVALLDVRLGRQRVRYDLGDLVRRLRDAAHVDAGEDHDRRQDVRQWPREYDGRPPPSGLGLVRPGPLLAVPHPGHLGETAEEYYAERIDRFAELLFEDRGAEAYAELGDADADGLCGEHVAELVDDYEEDQAEDAEYEGHACRSPVWRFASCLAQASTAVMASMLSIGPKSGTTSRTSSIASGIERNCILPSRNASTTTSFAALSATGCAFPAFPASTASGRHLKTSLRGSAKVHEAPSNGTGVAPTSTLSG